jgi:VCBS repeat-containing protein
MSQAWKKSNRRKTQAAARRRPKLWRPGLSLTFLEDRTVPTTFTATNPTTILIPGDQSGGFGVGSPSPSNISVSGLTGVVTHLQITLNGLYHESGDDIDMLLVAPNGTNIYLMSDNGGPNPIGNPADVPPTGIQLVFDSNATQTLPSPVFPGTYAPLNVDEGDPDTITGLPAGTPPPVTVMGLGGFSGINPNGNWSLYVNDDTALAAGKMLGGWTLTFDYRANSAPVANPDTYNVNENTTLTVSNAAAGVVANDTDADGDPKIAHLVTGPSNGKLTFNPDGTFTYVPNHYFSGTDMFTYRDDDGVVFGNTATVTINVAHINQPPTAVPDSYTLQNGGPQVVFPWEGVLANDVDPDGATANNVVLNENFKELTRQPFPAGMNNNPYNATGTDWSPTLPSGWTLDNNPAGTPPWPQPASPTAPGNVYDGWHVLDIDSWIAEQGDQDRSKFLNEFQFPNFNAPNVGSHTPVLVADGDAYDDYVGIGANHMYSYAYTPNIPLNGGVDGTLKLEFDQSFRPEDPSNGLQQGTVDVSYDGGTTWTNLLTQDNTHGPNAPYNAGDESRINQHVVLNTNDLGVPNPPGGTAKFRFGYLDASNEWWWAVTNIKVTDSKTDPTTLSANLVTGPTHGTLSLQSNGGFTYTANAGYTGPDSFTYTATDGVITTAPPTTVSLTINANTKAPTPVNDTYSMQQDSTLTVAGPNGVLVNDGDQDTGGFAGLTVAKATSPAHGTLTFNNDGSFAYTPGLGYFGTDSFTYTLNDGANTSTPATVTFNIAQVNNFPPVAGNDAYSVTENGTLSATAATGVLANDTDADHNPLTALQVPVAGSTTQPQHGTLTFNADGSFTYTPRPFFYGTDTFTYEASDGTHFSNPATVTITVNKANVAPVAHTTAYSTPLNTALTTTAANGLLGNVRDDGTITTLLTENFDELPLQPYAAGMHGQNGGVTGNPNGDWTDAVPAGWTRDNQNTPPPLSPSDPGEALFGWHVTDIDSWIHEQGDQARSSFLNENLQPGYSQVAPNLVGSHNHVLVADGDAYQDYVSISPTNPMNTAFISPSVSLAGLNQNSLTLEFDSSFRPEELQEAKVEVTYDGGTTWNSLLDYTTGNTGGSGAKGHINEHLTLDANNPAGATAAQFRFSYLKAGNDWWWTIDNIKVTGSTPNAGATLTTAVAAQPHHGAVTVNPNGSFTYTPTTGFTGLDSFTYTANDVVNTSAPATAYVLVGNPAVGVQVNDGSIQRSEVRSLTVAFNGTATFAGSPTAAFQLTGVGAMAGAYGNVTLVPTVQTINGITLVTLGFAGTNGIDPISAQNGAAPSLADGRFQLSVLSSQVNVNGVPLAGGQPNGDYNSPADTFHGTGLGLYRLFGDASGDGVVDPTDLGQFRSTFNANSAQANYIAFLDANNNGVVDAQDLSQFRARFNVNVFV